MTSTSGRQIIVIGASSGGVPAMLSIAERLPAGFPAPILLVQHIGAHHSRLPDLLGRCGPIRARWAEEGDVPEPGTIHIAPADRHLRIEAGRLHVWRGPKENHARPAINPLFRSAAIECGPRAAGVVLTGLLDDGTAGLRAIKECGGVTVVQAPADALEPSMPWSALANVDVDHVATVADMPALLCRLAEPRADLPRKLPVPERLRIEHAAAMGASRMDELKSIGKPSALTCPDCGGGLFELDDRRPLRFICHTGHSYGLQSLALAQKEVAEDALWKAVRVLQEKVAVLHRVADARAQDLPGSGSAAESEAQELANVLVVLRKLVLETGSRKSFDLDA